MTDLIDRFHQHLDRCEQCREHPTNLCPLGQIILNAAMSTISSPVQKLKKESKDEQTQEGR